MWGLLSIVFSFCRSSLPLYLQPSDCEWNAFLQIWTEQVSRIWLLSLPLPILSTNLIWFTFHSSNTICVDFILPTLLSTVGSLILRISLGQIACESWINLIANLIRSIWLPFWGSSSCQPSQNSNSRNQISRVHERKKNQTKELKPIWCGSSNDFAMYLLL